MMPEGIAPYRESFALKMKRTAEDFAKRSVLKIIDDMALDAPHAAAVHEVYTHAADGALSWVNARAEIRRIMEGGV